MRSRKHFDPVPGTKYGSWSGGKNLPPGAGNGNPSQYSCPGKAHGPRGLVGCSLQLRKSQMGLSMRKSAYARVHISTSIISLCQREPLEFSRRSFPSSLLPGLSACSHHHGEVCEPAEKKASAFTQNPARESPERTAGCPASSQRL